MSFWSMFVISSALAFKVANSMTSHPVTIEEKFNGVCRWINRDPIQELGGLNLFAYVSNAPTSNYDSSGLGQAAGTGKCKPNMTCDEITCKINANTGELIKREHELLNDQLSLPWLGEKQSVESHHIRNSDNSIPPWVWTLLGGLAIPFPGNPVYGGF